MRNSLFLSSAAVLLALSAAKAPVRFPVEKPVLINGHEYSAEDTMRARADAVMRTCFKYAEDSRPESTSDLFVGSVEAPEFVSSAFVFDVTPPFQVCSPKHSLDKSLEAFHRQVVAAYPDNKKKSQKKKTNEDLLKKRMKVLAVSHPFKRLVRAYLSVFKSGEGQNFEKIRKAYNKKANSHFTFKEFVRFVTRGGREFFGDSDLLEKWSLQRDWQPYYKYCQVCHNALYPTLVVKAEDHMQEDVEVLRDIFGLDDYDFEEETIADSSLKAAFSQLSKQDVDDLVEHYRIDFEMYRYTPEEFYSIIA